MKEQYLLTSDSRAYWASEVNRMLREGWYVVPGTMCISTAATATNNRYSTQLNIESKSEFAIVLEHEVPDRK
jgi:uncharacterized membrane protein